MQRDAGRRNLGGSWERIPNVLINKKSPVPDDAEANVETMDTMAATAERSPPLLLRDGIVGVPMKCARAIFLVDKHARGVGPCSQAQDFNSNEFSNSHVSGG